MTHVDLIEKLLRLVVLYIVKVKSRWGLYSHRYNPTERERAKSQI